jgi:hypothetical protein
MIDEQLTRRIFLQGSGTVAGSVLARAGLPALIAAAQSACTAREEDAAFENIPAAAAREFLACLAHLSDYRHARCPGSRSYLVHG